PRPLQADERRMEGRAPAISPEQPYTPVARHHGELGLIGTDGQLHASRRRDGRHLGAWSGWAAVFVAAGLLVAGCAPSEPTASKRTKPVVTTAPAQASPTLPAATTTTVRRALPPDAFNDTDAALVERVRSAGLSLGLVRVTAADGAVIHEHSVGGMSGS